MKKRLLWLVVPFAFLLGCGSAPAPVVPPPAASPPPPPSRGLVRNNNVWEGPIHVYYEDLGNNLMDSILWIKDEKKDAVASLVQIIAIDEYQNNGKILTVRDTDGQDNREYSFFWIDISDGAGDGPTVGEELYLVWTQGSNIISNPSTNDEFTLNREDYRGTKEYDCFVSPTIFRVCLLLTHAHDNLAVLELDWKK